MKGIVKVLFGNVASYERVDMHSRNCSVISTRSVKFRFLSFERVMTNFTSAQGECNLISLKIHGFELVLKCTRNRKTSC